VTTVASVGTDRAASTSAQDAGDAAWWVAAYASIVAGIVLRLWALGSHDLTFDEAFTGAGANKPLRELFPFLRSSDTHPPLDYLIRRPVAGTGSELLLRLPSVTFSIALLLLLAWWLRGRGPFGALTVIVASVLPFLVLHGREARMYSGVMFFGLVASVASERWLERPRRGAVVIVAAAGVLALLSLDPPT